MLAASVGAGAKPPMNAGIAAPDALGPVGAATAPNRPATSWRLRQRAASSRRNWTATGRKRMPLPCLFFCTQGLHGGVDPAAAVRPASQLHTGHRVHRILGFPSARMIWACARFAGRDEHVIIVPVVGLEGLLVDLLRAHRTRAACGRSGSSASTVPACSANGGHHHLPVGSRTARTRGGFGRHDELAVVRDALLARLLVDLLLGLGDVGKREANVAQKMTSDI